MGSFLTFHFINQSLASYNYDYILFILAYEMTELYQGKTKSEQN